MAERVGFNDPEYAQAFIRRFNQEEARKESQQASRGAANEERMHRIHALAKMYRELGLVIGPEQMSQQELEEFEAKHQAMVNESNQMPLGQLSYINEFTLETNSNKRRFWGSEFLDDEYTKMFRHDHPPKTGWGPYRNMTLDEYRNSIFRPAARRYINNKLSLAEQADEILE